MDAKNTEKELKISTYRQEGSKRIFSNYVEVSSTPFDISIRFSDIKPPTSREEVEVVKKIGKLKLPIEVEIIMPLVIANSFLQVLKNQLEKKGK